MSKITREDIQIIGRCSNWSENGVSKTLAHTVYADKSSWLAFLRILFLGIGASFTVAGIIFFFAYNWADLNKFVKLGLLEGLVLLVALGVLFFKTNPLIKKTLLAAAAVLVGASLAVFGQVYQTGANAYDFFLAWVLFISLWVIISRFAPLWIIYIALINTTIFLYADQVAQDWSEFFVINFLFVVNLFFLIGFLLISKFKPDRKFPAWSTHLLALAITVIGTIGISMGIFEDPEPLFWILFVLVGISYGLGIWYGLKAHNTFYLAIISFSVILIICTLLLRVSEGAGMLFIIGLFIIGSVTVLIKILMELQRKWTR
ncbi:DUF2157 domain-containing protein [Flagellimonas olearia]|uniref:DUF2157 domain-containing protein n=1 Tax=Flagellimonas olearia TaxID=552546 RepID=A0A6I1DUU8_9FLAO|nr:DUF2157 domain-containing protein [Allomuricauda olearia]KAB7528625.1 DUF2157 domain-containing protein [Allomuricauda olearia]